METSIWGIYRIGDVVEDRDAFPGVQFVVKSRWGNAYCPVIGCVERGRIATVRHSANLAIRDVKLVGTELPRPLRRCPLKTLLGLRRHGHVDALREFAIRVNSHKPNSVCQQRAL